LNKPNHISEEVLRKFLAGELSQEQLAEWKLFFEENSFEKEALEGLQMLSAEELQQDIEDLKSKIEAKSNVKMPSHRANAASIAILLISLALALSFIKSLDTKQNLSFENTSKSNIQELEVADTMKNKPHPP